MRPGKNVGHGSDVGRIRPLNEDYHRVWRFPLPDSELTLLAVADGMGGAAAGEIASRLAIQVLDEMFTRYAQEVCAGNPVVGLGVLAEKSVKLANRRVFNAAAEHHGHRGMGTTLTFAAIHGRRAFVGHVGDSRAYLIRGQQIYQVTKDHSWIEEQLERGVLDERQAEQHEWRNLLTRVLGTQVAVAPDIAEIGVNAGDFLVLSTDGLHDLVRPEEILAEVRQTGTAASSVEYLIALANRRGGHDNITVVMAEVLS
jgi:protein phosphatase